MITAKRMDPERRLWLTATSIASGASLITTAVPFVTSMAPSDRAHALSAPVELGLKDFEPGELRTVARRGKPVFVLRRSPKMLDALPSHDDLLADPRWSGGRRLAARKLLGLLIFPDFVCTTSGGIFS